MNNTEVLSSRAVSLTDNNDSTSWTNVHNLTTSYQSFVASSRSDYDYYSYQLTKSRVVFIDTALTYMSAPNDMEIYLYKNSTSNLVASYYSSTDKTSVSFIPCYVFLEPSDILYIKTRTTYEGCNYSIRVVTDSNISEVYTFESTGTSIDRYYDGSGKIYYYADSSMNAIIPYNTESYKDIFEEALEIWNNVGDLELILTTTTSYDIMVSTDTYENIQRDKDDDEDLLGYCSWKTSKYGFLNTKRYFHATNIVILDDMTAVHTDIIIQGQGLSIEDAYHQYLLNLYVHEIGHSIGLNHCYNNEYEEDNREHNVMYHTNFAYCGLGDGDIASYLSIWG